ncbi:hypothetical protein [Pelagicoccus sp. SDUM812003]|uniref:hypothetical protein n=1 Tax=Pelagicoccus sp. SDUM812003 TaxID=3041267 RepID=UPI00280C7C2E|nr:hypothetical protein [Pelagicoccus sp. SDUM812003]MDQ8203092.1 hypothetical protein [Pelagicoccus sp. SDUM812003]
MTRQTLGSAGLAEAMRALLLMRIRELSTGASLTRLAVSFAIALAILWMVIRPGDTERFWWVAISVFALKFLPVYCLTKGGETLRSELKEGTIEYLWTRQASKGSLYLAFYASSLLQVMVQVAGFLLALSLVAFARGVAVDFLDLSLLWVCGLGAAFAFTAIAIGVGAFSAKYVVFGLFYFSFVELGLGALPTGARGLAVSAHVKDVLTPVSYSELSAAFGALGGSLLAMAIISAVALLLGAFVFLRSVYSVGGDKEG